MTQYNGQSDPRLQAIAEAERERFYNGQESRRTNGANNGHFNVQSSFDDEEPLVCERLEALPIISIPPRPWAYGRFLLFGQASVIGAVDGGGKGALAVVIALAMIIGRSLLGEHVWRTGPVAIITYEDDQTEWRRRIAAACLEYEIDYSAVVSSFYFICRPRGRIRLAAQSEVSNRNAVVFPDGNAIVEHLKKIGAALLIVDPFNHAHTLEDGNSNAMVAQLAAEIARIAAESAVAALVLHHLRKGSTGHADDLMGALALRATFRAARILVRMTTDEAGKLEVPPEEAWRYSRIAGSKENYAPPPDRAAWYKFESVELGNGAGLYPDGDNVQVIKPWSPPSASKDMPKSKIAEIFAALRNGPEEGEFYSSRSNATHWAGSVITNVTGKSEDEARRILRTWIKNGVLAEDEYYSKKRHTTVTRVAANEGKAAEILGALYRPLSGAKE